MDRLTLARRLSRECGINQIGPSSTTNQTGEYLRVVTWIDDAYKSVQLVSSQWQFLRKEFSFSLTAAKVAYTPAEALLTDFSEWVSDDEGDSEDFRIYLTASDEQFMTYMPWEMFRVAYMVGTQRTMTGRPSVYTIKPDDALMFYPIPDAVYTCVGEYFMVPDVMELDKDIPIFPARFHEIILYRAMMYYGAYSQEPDKYAVGEREYKRLLRTLKKSQLPQMAWGNPLV
jgi:hypothetical protein